MRMSQNFSYGLYTCRLLSAVLSNTKPPCLPENMTPCGLYEFQKAQDVSNLAYVALKQLGFSDAQLKDYCDDYKLNLLREARFELATQQVFEALEKEKIPFIPLKGVVIKNYFPNPSLRTFTDVDLFIGDKIQEVRAVMSSLGYERKYEGESNDESFVKKPSLHFEMHNELFPDFYRFGGYFDDPFKHTIPVEGKKYFRVFRDEDFFIHVLAHLYKHFTHNGCGLRQFLDIYVLTENMNLDFEYIRNELKTIELEDFMDAVIKENAFLFGGNKPDKNDIEIAEYIFSNDLFGSDDMHFALLYAKNEKNDEEKFFIWKVKHYFNKWQLPYSKMKLQYPVLKKLPFLLPFCYIHKLFRVLFFRRDVLKQEKEDIKIVNDDFYEFVDHVMEISGAKSGIKNQTEK